MILLGFAEAAVLVASVYFAAVIAFGGIGFFEESLGPIAPRAAVLAGVILLSLIAMGLYRFHRRAYFHEIFVRLVVGVGLGSAVLAAAYYVFPSLNLQPRVAAVAVLTAVFALLGVRYLFVQSVDESVFRRRTLIYGAGERARAITDLRRRADRRGFQIVGTICAPGDSNCNLSEAERNEEYLISRLVRETRADEVVIAMDDRRGNLPIRELLDLKLGGTEVIDLLEFLERETGKIRVDLVKPSWFVFSSGFRISKLRKVEQRALDLLVATALLLLAWPVMLIVAACIKLEDGLDAPILYRQRRVGLGGSVFDVLKFRSMTPDAEADGKAVWAQANDKRVTRVGAVIRKYRLDELPQVFNVLAGQMSIVGPRPERPEFVEGLTEKIAFYKERHAVKPGVTGWAQLRYAYGASESDAVEKLQYDLYYIKNQNLLLDLMIILQTVEVVLWGKGAR
jgi:sugar transferase (PEP-CTERM system associated)